ncbi:MAG: hypothetical protein MZV64_73170 [Ignavibacteriales bacterium]|nr:hypothetical protein [Ignavibacteriales bacterium]
MDQIFPHELLHVIARQLAGEPRGERRQPGARHRRAHRPGDGVPGGRSRSTSRSCAWTTRTRILRHARFGRIGDVRARAERRVRRIRPRRRARASARQSRLNCASSCGSAPSEQVQRYHAVKANRLREAGASPGPAARREATARRLPVSERGAGRPRRSRRSRRRAAVHRGRRRPSLLAVGDRPGLQQRYRDEAFYGRFGAAPQSRRSPRQRVSEDLPRAARRAGRRHGRVPSRLRRRVPRRGAAGPAGGERRRSPARTCRTRPEIWLANPALQTGTSLFDQFRALPRVHTFDANAASALDWLAVPGVTPDAAEQAR